jgi:hypothetical protein
MAEKVKQKMIDAMRLARKVSVTTDIWSSKCSSDSFIGITAHMVNPVTKKREVYRICCRVFNIRHTGINIAKMMKNLFIEFGIDKKVFFVLSDNASNMNKAVHDMHAMLCDEDGELEEFSEDDSEDDESDCDSEPENIEDDDEIDIVEQQAKDLEQEMDDHDVAFKSVQIQRLPCVTHTAQLGINKCINKKKQSFGSVLRKSRKIVKKYRKSPKAKAVLKKKVRTKLAGYVKTRWWTDLAMAKSVVKAAKVQGNPLNQMMDQMGWNIELTERDIATLEQFLSIMSPFQDLVDKLGGEKNSTIHLVYPSLKELFALLDEKINKNLAKGFCKDLKTELNKYFRFVMDPDFPEFLPVYVAATYLDPFYKFALDEEMTRTAKEYIKTLVGQEQTDLNENVEIVLGGEAVNTDKPRFVLPGFSRLSADILKKSQDDAIVGNNTFTTALDKDFALYEQKAKAVFSKAVNEAEKRHRKVQEQMNEDVMDIASASGISSTNTTADEADNSGASKAEQEATVKPKDPLDFWIAQVSSKFRSQKICKYFYISGKVQRVFNCFELCGPGFDGHTCHKCAQ